MEPEVSSFSTLCRHLITNPTQSSVYNKHSDSHLLVTLTLFHFLPRLQNIKAL